MRITVDRQGAGRFHLYEPFPDGRSGSFSIPQAKFVSLVGHLEAFRTQAVPMNEESFRKYFETPCPQGVPYVTDASGVTIRWIGPNSDLVYWADFGCDYKRNAARNANIRAILRSLPVPLES